jgi:dolichol kinase
MLAESLANPAFVDTTRALGVDNSLAQNVGGAVSTIGVFLTQLFSYVTINPLMNGLLMMQAIILMGMYMFLPLITFLSGYNLKVMLYGAVGVFTVKFWAILWSITLWMDAHLVDAMYPQGTFKLTELVRSTGNDYKLTLMAMLMMTMFIGLPALWTVMMGWIGISIGSNLAKLAGESERHANDAGRKSTGR